jgi:hypothetical protein
MNTAKVQIYKDIIDILAPRVNNGKATKDEVEAFVSAAQEYKKEIMNRRAFMMNVVEAEQQYEDWLKIRSLWCDWMYYQAADRNFDYENDKKAWNEYVKAKQNYKAKYGVECKYHDVL